MSKAEFLIVIFTFIGAFVTIINAIEKNIINILLKKEATTSDKAVEIQKNILISRWRLKRLKQSGIIIEDNSAKCYFDESGYKILLKRRVLTTISIIVIVLISTLIY